MPTSDNDFVRTWKACGASPTEVAKVLGIEYRAVLKRRTHIERKLGIHLPTATQIGDRGRGDGGFQNDCLQRLIIDRLKGPAIIFSDAHWWPGISETPVAFAHMSPTTYYPNHGYFSRVGVLPKHRGHGLQSRLMAAAEKVAKGHCWEALVSDTTRNPHSAANFIRRGWVEFEPDPEHRANWGNKHTRYWRKDL